ncbi:MAG: hypothetical protein RIR39_581 [Pseudomonadota bacterium]|jgi:hypothetical protein
MPLLMLQRHHATLELKNYAFKKIQTKVCTSVIIALYTIKLRIFATCTIRLAILLRVLNIMMILFKPVIPASMPE